MLKKMQFLLAILLITLLISGCLTPVKANLIQKVYLEPQVVAKRGIPTGYSIGLRDVECAKSIGNYITYLKDGGILFIDEQQQWAEHPSEIVYRTVYKTLKNTGRFSDVADAIEIQNPDLIAIIKLKKFFIAEASNKNEVLFSLEFKIRHTSSRKLIVEKEFEISKPYESSNDYIIAFNQALYEFSEQLSELINNLDM